jgi:hypothetical protein
MNNLPTIRRLLAALFLLLFAFCVTPKRFLHDLLANHRDTSMMHGFPQQQVTTSGFHCNVDDLVVVAPFLPGIQITIPPKLNTGSAVFSDPVISIILADHLQFDNRGPPASFCS